MTNLRKSSSANSYEPLYKKTAARLRAYIRKTEQTELPPVLMLSREFGVGESTMRRALGELCREGLVCTAQGKKTRITRGPENAGKMQENGTPALSAKAAEFRDTLRGEIMDGARKIGRPLPKIAYSTAKEHLSTRSVVLVYRCLEDEGMVHKEGARWIVGPRPMPHADDKTGTVLSDHALSIVVLCTTSDSWYRIIRNHHESTFVFAFSEEISKHHIRVYLCGADPRQSTRVFPSGFSDVSKLILSLEERYLGMIVVMRDFPELLLPNPVQWLSFLARTGKPVVSCDVGGEHRPFFHRHFSKDLKFIHIGIDHDAETRAVLRVLAGLGHTRIGIPYVRGMPKEWSLERMRRFRETAAGRFPHVHIVPAEMSVNMWEVWEERSEYDIPEWTKPAVLIENIRQRILTRRHDSETTEIARSAPSRAEILSAGDSLVSLLDNENVSALVVPNDVFACQIYAYLQLLGISIPRDISIVSFDNSIFVHSYPIATLDRGYTHMAYCAVHACIGDVPIQTGEYGFLAAHHRIVDRGSLARARRKRLRFPL